MLLRSFLIFASLIAFTACVVFPHHRSAYLICCPLVLVGTVLLLSWESQPSVHSLAREDYPCKSDKRNLGRTDSNSALVLHASLIAPPPTLFQSVVSTKMNNAKASARNQTASPMLRRSLSYVLPKSDYCWNAGVLSGDDDERDRSIRLVERSAADFVTHLSAKRDNGAANLERVPSLTAEEVNELADEFIARFHEHMRLERQESNKRAEENLRRQESYKRYLAMLERPAG